MGEPVVAVLEAVSTAEKHHSPVQCVVPGMCACSSLETWARFAGLFLHWLLLVPCFSLKDCPGSRGTWPGWLPP